MKLSILVPSLRPKYLKKCLESIDKHTKNVEHEVLVNNEGGGIYRAVEKMFKESKGEYIIHIPDDVLATPNWAFNMIRFIESQENPIFEGNFRCRRDQLVGLGTKEVKENFRCDKLVSSFPAIRRDVVDVVGGFIDTKYNSFYGDPDLSLRVWEAGGEVKTAPDAWIHLNEQNDEVHQYSKNLYEKQDGETFKKRWNLLRL